MLKIKFFFSCILTFILQAMALAHPLDIGLMDISQNGKTIILKLELNPYTAKKLLARDDIENWGNEAVSLYNRTLKKSRLLVDGISCLWLENPQIALKNPEVLSLLVRADCAQSKGDFFLEMPFLSDLESTFNLIIKTHINGNARVLSADPVRIDIKFNLDDQSDKNFGDFVLQGFRHIGVTSDQWIKNSKITLPMGIDHILFLLALVLSGGNLLNLLKMITGFTIGHTVSVSLAAFDIINISGEWVEPVIALTIGMVSLDALFKFGLHRKWTITLVIGLIHGLAFAEALVDLNLSVGLLVQAVIGFNLGVELAQAILIAVLFPLILLLNKYRVTKIFLIPACSVAIFIMASYWLIERIQLVV